MAGWYLGSYQVGGWWREVGVVSPLTTHRRSRIFLQRRPLSPLPNHSLNSDGRAHCAALVCQPAIRILPKLQLGLKYAGSSLKQHWAISLPASTLTTATAEFQLRPRDAAFSSVIRFMIAMCRPSQAQRCWSRCPGTALCPQAGSGDLSWSSLPTHTHSLPYPRHSCRQMGLEM